MDYVAYGLQYDALIFLDHFFKRGFRLLFYFHSTERWVKIKKALLAPSKQVK